MKCDVQVRNTCKNAWYHLHQISKIKKFLTNDQLKSVIRAFVISKLDYNNGILAGAPKVLKSKLQSVQTAAAKLIAGIKRYEWSEAPMQQLHWLPVEYRIKFKVLLVCYKCLNMTIAWNI